MQGEADAVIGYPVLRVVVGADFFGAVAGFDLSAALRGQGGLLLFHFLFVETGAEHAHGFGAIFDLGFFVLLGDDQAAGNVRDAHGGIGGVHGLAAGTGGAESVDAQIFGFDFDVDVVGFREHGYGCGGGVNAALLLCGRDALNTVYAAFVFQLGVNLVALNGGDDFFYSALGGGRAFEDFDFPALDFGEARVHAVEIAGEDAGFVAAGASADFHDHALFIEGIFRQEEKF